MKGRGRECTSLCSSCWLGAPSIAASAIADPQPSAVAALAAADTPQHTPAALPDLWSGLTHKLYPSSAHMELSPVLELRSGELTRFLRLQVESLTGWLLGKESAQAALQGHEDPALHSSEVDSKVGEVGSCAWHTCSPCQPDTLQTASCRMTSWALTPGCACVLQCARRRASVFLIKQASHETHRPPCELLSPAMQAGLPLGHGG